MAGNIVYVVVSVT